MIATLFQSIGGSSVTQGIAGVITLVLSLALYKGFVDFIQPWEEGIRTRNNKPDFRHASMGLVRRALLWVGCTAIVLQIVVLFFVEADVWLMLGIFAALCFGITKLLTTWPRTDEWVHRGPGIAWRVPGWFNWTHISLKRSIRTPVMDSASDAAGAPVLIQLAYQWSRTKSDPAAQWQSWNDIENLELTMDALLMGVVQLELKHIFDAVKLDPAELLAFAERVFAACNSRFYTECGTTLHYVSVASLGPSPQVAGSSVIAAALSKLQVDEAAERLRVADAAAASLATSLER